MWVHVLQADFQRRNIILRAQVTFRDIKNSSHLECFRILPIEYFPLRNQARLLNVTGHHRASHTAYL
jgi:hypothetical protein